MSRTELQETLGSNLEELQRMSGIVNDMLFLSQADRGAAARTTRVCNLRELVYEVLAYHEAEAFEAKVSFMVVGDKSAAVDRSEEHTSELQSLMRISYAVFCLNKKKNKQQ